MSLGVNRECGDCRVCCIVPKITEVAKPAGAPLVELVDRIGAAHVARGLADPCATYPVPAMLNKIAAINPPRSWSKAEQRRFRSLPYSLQTYVCKREAER
jgi:hypothetical protein